MNERKVRTNEISAIDKTIYRQRPLAEMSFFVCLFQTECDRMKCGRSENTDGKKKDRERERERPTIGRGKKIIYYKKMFGYFVCIESGYLIDIYHMCVKQCPVCVDVCVCVCV